MNKDIDDFLKVVDALPPKYVLILAENPEIGFYAEWRNGFMRLKTERDVPRVLNELLKRKIPLGAYCRGCCKPFKLDQRQLDMLMKFPKNRNAFAYHGKRSKNVFHIHGTQCQK